jgi:hypothetical protein
MVFPVSELAKVAKTRSIEDFEQHYGVAALVLDLGPEETQRAALRLGLLPTVATAPGKNFLDGVLLLLRAFRELSAYFLESGTREVALGRSPDCQVVIDDPSVSKVHARLRLDGQQWQVKDEGSRNGTFINGERLGEAWQLVTDGDTLAFGDAQLIFLTSRTLRAQLSAL